MYQEISGYKAAEQLIKSLYPAGQHSGSLIAKCHLGGRLHRIKIPVEQTSWLAANLRRMRQVELSSCVYAGKDVFLNCTSTKLISVELDRNSGSIRDKPVATIARLVAWRLESENIPLFSFLIVTTSKIIVGWALEEAIDEFELDQCFIAELGARNALDSLGATRVAGVSRMIPLPFGYGADLKGARLVTAGPITCIDTDHLLNKMLDHTTASAAQNYHRSFAVLNELNALFFDRFFEIANYQERFWIWIAAYAAAIHPFVSIPELNNCIKAVAESLENENWRKLRTRAVTNTDTNYVAYLDIVSRNAREGEVRLADRSYYPVNRSKWAQIAAEQLRVTSYEAAKLDMKYFRPDEIASLDTTYFKKVKRVSIGIPEYANLADFLALALAA